jgi:tetratricopeptide (TPR) repeat protein
VNLTLKAISKQSIGGAIAKAEHYRALNEPAEAEPICRDILMLDPTNQTATRLLGSVLTDQFTGRETDAYNEAEALFQSLTDPYQRLYRSGLLRERRAKAELRAGRPPHLLAPLLREALRLYEQAESIRPPGNDEAILRWNRCIRLIRSRSDLEWSVGEIR